MQARRKAKLRKIRQLMNLNPNLIQEKVKKKEKEEHKDLEGNKINKKEEEKAETKNEESMTKGSNSLKRNPRKTLFNLSQARNMIKFVVNSLSVETANNYIKTSQKTAHKHVISLGKNPREK